MKEAPLSLTIMKEVTLSLKIMSLTFTFNDNYVGGCTFNKKNQAAALSLKKVAVHSRPGPRLASRVRSFFLLPGRRKGGWHCCLYRMKAMIGIYDQRGEDDDNGDNGFFGENQFIAVMLTIEIVFIMSHDITAIWFTTE